MEKVCALLRNQGLIACTGCRYCTEVCPQGIAIPELFAFLNAIRQGQEASHSAIEGGMPSDCVKCGQCEHICPQQLNIRELLVAAGAELES